MKQSELRRAAYHEAGHAVVLRHFGVRIICLQVFEDYSGICKVDRRNKRTPFVLTLGALAGAVAEQIWCGVDPNFYGASEDFQRALEMAGGRDIPHFAHYASLLLREYESVVHDLALALTEKKALREGELWSFLKKIEPVPC